MTAKDQLDLPIYAPNGQYLFTCEGLTVRPPWAPGEPLGYPHQGGVHINLRRNIEKVRVTVSYLPSGQSFGILQNDELCADLLTAFRVVKDPDVIERIRKQYGSPETGFTFRGM
ncbi:hypothetical protein ACRRRS_21755 (plasmid) [Brucella anthropi]|uniref:hypothetical protein n=1 Tax=Brucella anthropi TaxID=529 RepID=UPI003D7D2A8A